MFVNCVCLCSPREVHVFGKTFVFRSGANSYLVSKRCAPKAGGNDNLNSEIQRISLLPARKVIRSFDMLVREISSAYFWTRKRFAKLNVGIFIYLMCLTGND